MTYDEIKADCDEKLNQGYHCSQIVLSYWAKQFGIDEVLALRSASGLGMGANCGGTCGTITATAIALGWAHGFSGEGCSEQEGGVESMVREIVEAFREQNGSLMCDELLWGGFAAGEAILRGEETPALQGLNPWMNCGKYCADAITLAQKLMADADLTWYEAPEPAKGPLIATGIGCSAGGIAVGALAAGVIAYEKRRAENEGRR